jgi:3'(2'), 5'-bisphosphate nucleotidase
MLDKELSEAARLAREAGRIILDLYGDDIAVQYKTKSDPVTEADRKANDFLVAGLKKVFPDDGIVAEELPDVSDAARGGRVWYVDPLDGTKEFVARNGEFAVMIGLTIDAESVLGVVYQPVADKLYTGVVASQEAFVETGGRRERLQVSDTADPAELTLVVSRSHRGEATDRVVQELGIRHEMKSGSVGLKVGLLAERKADLYVHLSDKSSAWDACGPEAILRAAGGRFAKLSGDPYRYASTDVQNHGGILACNAAAYEAVLPVVRAVAKTKGLA